MDTLVHMSSNIEEDDQKILTKQKFVGMTKALGATEGRGANARPALFQLTVEATREGILTKRDEVAHYFAMYAQASAEARGAGVVEQKSLRQQVAKLGVAFKLGQLNHVNGCEIVATTLEAHKAQLEANQKNDYSAYDALVKVGREQVKFKDTPLTREVIDALICKPVAEIPEEADMLEKIATSLDNFATAEDQEWSEESRDLAVETAATIMKRVKELGGSTRMRAQAAKLAKKAKDTEAQLAALNAQMGR